MYSAKHKHRIYTRCSTTAYVFKSLYTALMPQITPIANQSAVELDPIYEDSRWRKEGTFTVTVFNQKYMDVGVPDFRKDS